MAEIVRSIFDVYIPKLNELGYIGRYFNSNHLLILDYKLPNGWDQSITDLLMKIPDHLSNGIHGIQIPSTLTHNINKKLSTGRRSGHYVLGWDLLSCMLDPALCDDNILRNHMILVKRVLSFEEHKA